MTTLLICIIAIIAPLFLVLGTLVLLGKFDNLLLKNAAKKGETINLARSRKILGLTLLSDSVVGPAICVAVFYLCSK
jgi:hypothetical protein